MQNILDISRVEEAAKLLSEARKIVIFTHIAPDGDAMGSSLAVYHWLKSSGSSSADVHVITPNAASSFLKWMPGAEEVRVYETDEECCRELIAEADLHICLDFNEPKRIGPVGEKLMLNPCPKIMIDHHLNPSDFASISFSFPDASSTCELVYRLLMQFKALAGHAGSGAQTPATLPVNIATAIYTGLMTDTGNFSYNSGNPDLYEIIAALLRSGVDKDAVYDAVFNQASPDRLRLTGYSLYRKMQLYPAHHLALITLSMEELDRFRYQPGDTEGIVNMPLQISTIYYSVLMREQPPKPGTSKPVVKLSFRSQGDRPVNIFAHEVFNGGGHMNASGGEMVGSLSQAVRLFEQSFPMYIPADKQ